MEDSYRSGPIYGLLIFMSWLMFSTFCITTFYIGTDKQSFKRKNVIIFVSISSNMSCGTQKNRIIQTVLSSTHNICLL